MKAEVVVVGRNPRGSDIFLFGQVLAVPHHLWWVHSKKTTCPFGEGAGSMEVFERGELRGKRRSTIAGRY